MRKKIFTFLLALAASVGLSWATTVTWNNNDITGSGFGTSFTKDGVTITAGMIDFEDKNFMDGGTFTTTLGNFTKIEVVTDGSCKASGIGWSGSNHEKTWTGNASSVSFSGDIMGMGMGVNFVFTIGEPDPTYTVALQDGTVNADKVTLSATSAVEGATITVTPDEEYEITEFSATYAVVVGQLGTIYEIDATLDPGTGAYSFTMPAYDVTIEATIALKPVPEGDIYAGFTATAGSGGFNNEGHANLVDNKFISADWTKWCADNSYKSVPTGESGDACWWIDFEASAALNLTGYILTTGNDTGNEHGRNPKNWVLKAKLNAGDAWTTIATVTDDVTMKNKSFKDYKFFVDQSGTFQYFRFEVFANQGAGVMQLCELRLIGTEAPAPAPVAVTGVTLDQNEVQMTVGDETLMLTATVAPDDATDKTVVWTSSDPSVATVANGIVTAVAAGTATITATATNGTPDDTTDDFSATCDVIVSASSDEGSGSTGALPGKFSVSASQVVYFSRGNLQASTTDLGANWTWAFAKKQYNCVAANASNTAISGNGTVSTNGTVDLFGWSTAATQYGIHVKPFNSTYSGDFVDWGSNPDLIAALGTGWRTLTSDEWTYLLDTRTTTSGVRYAKAEITDKIYPGTTTTIKGLIILPDDWSTDYHALASTNTADAAFTSNQITSTVWKNELEAHGAVFMPAAGYRMATSVYSYSDRGYYWSATPNGADNAYELIFIGDNVYLANNGRRFDGHSVRLVTETAPAPATPTYTLQLHVNDALMGSVALQNPSNDIVDNGNGTYTVPEGAEVTLQATPNEGYEFIGWKASSTICDFNECEFVDLHKDENPLTVDMYMTAAFMAEFAAVAPADNSVKLYHNFSGEWADTEAFGIFDDYTSEYAKISMILEPGDYQFAVKVGGELRGDGTALSRDKQECILGEGLTANLTLNVDVKGTYKFYWFYDENRFAMDVPNVCGMYWKDVTAGNFEVTLGKESEVTLPTVYTTNMGFATNIFNGVDQVRLVSTDETVATIEYTLSLDGLGTITIHKAGECDIYAVHDITDYYCYDSVAFHLTVLPEPAPTTAVVIGDPNEASEVETFLSTYDGQTVPDLTIDRPVLNNMYNTLCLPFDMNAAQIAASSLNGVEIYEFVDADVTNDELYLYTSEEKHEIVAGRPYLVKFSAASQLDDLNFINVVINNADLDDQAVTIKGVTFKGTFQPIVLGAQEGLNFNGGHLFLAANNTLYWPNTNNPLKPFRAYFTVNVDAGQSAGMPVRRGMPAHIGGPAQIVTGVDQITNDQSPITNKVMINGALYIIRGDKMYDAQGQVIK